MEVPNRKHLRDLIINWAKANWILPEVEKDDTPIYRNSKPVNSIEHKYVFKREFDKYEKKKIKSEWVEYMDENDNRFGKIWYKPKYVKYGRKPK